MQVRQTNHMAIPVRIPTPLRKLTQNLEVVEAEGATIRELIQSLEQSYPGLKERICDDQDHIRRFVNIFLNDEDVRFLNESETQVKSGDEVSIVPAIAGG
jgi:sulfur-carrier protein